MALKSINLPMLDEATTLQNRLLSFEKWISGIYASLTINDDENKSNEEEVSILNLPSLKRGFLTSKQPSEKLELILADKQRLSSWILNYKTEFEKTGENDSVKIATFREAATRLKMLLDDSDFDEGVYRNKRQKGIIEINQMLAHINII